MAWRPVPASKRRGGKEFATARGNAAVDYCTVTCAPTEWLSPPEVAVTVTV